MTKYKEFAIVKLTVEGQKRFSGAKLCAVRLISFRNIGEDAQVKLVRDLLERAKRDGIKELIVFAEADKKAKDLINQI